MNKKAYGFTIVELLIVIVVIAILAAISIVAYRGIQERAQASSAQSAASQAATKLKVAFAQDSNYPADLSEIGITDSGTTSYQYTLKSDNTWCVTATTGAKSYYVNSTTHTTPTLGGCPGDSQGGQAAVTNLMSNPSLENNVTGWGFNTQDGVTGTQSRQTTGGFSGNAFRRFVASTSSTSAWIGSYISNIPANATSPFRVSMYVRSNVTMNHRMVVELRNSAGVNFSNVTGPTIATPAGVWTRVTADIPPTANLNRFTICVYAASRAWSSGDTVDYDAAMAVEGAVLPAYADGDSPSWIWTGTEGNSTSRGPAL